MKNIVRSSLTLTLVIAISGCNTLLKPNNLYNSHINYMGYNEDKHEFNGVHSGPLFAVGFDKSVGFARDNGGPWHWVGETGWITKENYEKKMAPFIKFLTWSSLPKSAQEVARLEYNNEEVIKSSDVEFRYFNDGSPAFVDLAYANTVKLTDLFLDNWSDYYTVQDIKNMVKMVNDEL